MPTPSFREWLAHRPDEALAADRLATLIARSGAAGIQPGLRREMEVQAEMTGRMGMPKPRTRKPAPMEPAPDFSGQSSSLAMRMWHVGVVGLPPSTRLPSASATWSTGSLSLALPCLSTVGGLFDQS